MIVPELEQLWVIEIGEPHHLPRSSLPWSTTHL